MEFLKKHYEKVLLSVVLLALGAAALWLPMAIKQAEDDAKVTDAPAPKSKPLPPINFDKEIKALSTVTNPPEVVFSGEHRLISSVTWKRQTNGRLTKILIEGADALTVTGGSNLYTVISYDRTAGSGYYINLQQQSSKPKSEYLKVGEKSKTGVFTLSEVKGTPEDPSEFVVELTDTKEKVSVKKDQPYKRVDGYSVDLKYAPENKTFNNKRLGDTLPFAGDTYKVVYINNNEVRVTATLTSKQTTIPWTGTP